MTTESNALAAPEANSGAGLAAGSLDLKSLRLSQNYAETLGVKKLLTTVPVRKPTRQEWVRVRPGEEFRLNTLVLELKEENETYVVAPELRDELVAELTPKALFLTINRQGVVTLWPVRLPGPDGRIDDWNASALEAVQWAEKQWIRVVANRSLGAYEVATAGGQLAEPDWPEVSFQEIVDIAFKGRYITDPSHPVVRRLRGLS